MQMHSASLKKFKDNGCPTTVPDSMFNEAWARRIHDQTLARLNERGGLSVKEMLMNIESKQWDYKPETIEDLNKLNELIKLHQA